MWIIENWQGIFAVIGVACTLATSIVALTPSPKDDTVVGAIVGWIVKVCDVLSVVNPKAPKA